LCGIVINASTCLRTLAADSPNLERARETARRTIRASNRAAEAVSRVSALLCGTNKVTTTAGVSSAPGEGGTRPPSKIGGRADRDPQNTVLGCGALCVLAISLALYSASACAQTQLATVSGTVTDPTGAVIEGAEVTVSSFNTGLKRVAPTDTNGQYHVAGLPPGIYSITAEKEKFQTQVLEEVALSSGTAIDVNLSLRVGTVPQNVTVKSDT